ncbi:MAG TPA: ATP-binding protein [Terriglobales bacterium]|nr:ATP-binding protein [Terriglobales bacterium]
MRSPLGSSISTRLTRMNLLVSGSALALACLSFFLYDQVTVRDGMVNNLTAQAQLVGTNSITALTFNDPDAATQTLAAFRSNSSIESAGVLTPDGVLFAQYSKSGQNKVVVVPALAADVEEGSWFQNDGLLYVRKIKFEDKTVGLVYLQSNLDILNRRMAQYILIAAAVLLVSLLVVVLFSVAFRRSVSKPITDLAEIAQTVTRDKNFSLRVQAESEARELAILIQSFNEMLSEIQTRDSALQAARSELEQRVEDRTRQLAAANRELEAFSYSVSHDLKGPLQAINGYAYMLTEDSGNKLAPDAKNHLLQITAATRRMANLIDDLLKLSHITTTTVHQETVDISDIARTIAGELQERQPDRRVRFVIPDMPLAEGDSSLLQIAVENLMRNAWKYTSAHEDAVIEVGCKTSPAGLMFFVRDDGAGFDPELADRLFKPFQRLHSNAEFPGTGIGLATVQRIMNRHGGRVWAEGTVERGATFYFTLPPAASAVEARRRTK